MAPRQVVCAITVAVILLSKGCQSQQSVCGRANLNTRIVGGQDAPPGAWPWQVKLNIGESFCGGSLINEQWVLTAAHCITRNDLNTTEVLLGFNNDSDPNPNMMKRTLSDIICHPAYDSVTFNNDICLLKLSATVEFTDYILPVCLAAENSTFFNGTPSWVTGFGDTDPGGPSATTLQEVLVPIVGPNECNCDYSGKITENMICAGVTGKDSCQGDSGGPLVTKKDSIWIQSGVVSFGAGCGLPQFPGVYARVSQYQEWIKNIVTGPEPGFVTFSQSGIDSDLSFTCINPPTDPPPTTFSPTTDDSLFGGGEDLFHFAHFSTLCVVLLCAVWQHWNAI
ncbi:chymotrypsinogen A-like isoform X2 [Parambassis ranga]|uniref:Chymotrypsinogen A-like isoform X2 n=1 Tax=Parambassis ranga TaxID=210632 RepID=A0A6P7IME3_9TELE|nr:chymotrypsinogen A-like isoform X2 [Parambassis ranga]